MPTTYTLDGTILDETTIRLHIPIPLSSGEVRLVVQPSEEQGNLRERDEECRPHRRNAWGTWKEISVFASCRSGKPTCCVKPRCRFTTVILSIV